MGRQFPNKYKLKTIDASVISIHMSGSVETRKLTTNNPVIWRGEKMVWYDDDDDDDDDSAYLIKCF